MVISNDLDVSGVVGPVAGTACAVVVIRVRIETSSRVVRVATAAGAASAMAPVLESDDLVRPRGAHVVLAARAAHPGVVAAPARERDPPASSHTAAGELARKAPSVAAADPRRGDVGGGSGWVAAFNVPLGLSSRDNGERARGQE